MSEATWDEEVILISNKEFKTDELNQQIPITKEETVCCYTKPVTRTEFYQAQQNDLIISEILVIHPYEYSGQKVVRFNNKMMSVVKTFKIDMEELELTCVEKIGDR